MREQTLANKGEKVMKFRDMYSPQIKFGLMDGRFQREKDPAFLWEVTNRVSHQLDKQKRLEVFDRAHSDDHFLVTFQYKGKTIQMEGCVLEEVA